VLSAVICVHAVAYETYAVAYEAYAGAYGAHESVSSRAFCGDLLFFLIFFLPETANERIVACSKDVNTPYKLLVYAALSY
jgi:hypothetical protein